MNNDITLLASAYLDGDITPAERAQVEADVDLLAEVERLRQVRAVLGATETAPISVRERHLSAALDAWDRLPAAERSGELRDATPRGSDAAAAAGAASVITPIPLGDRRKKGGNNKLLAIAAGLVLVLGGGLVVRGLAGGSSQGDTFSAEAPTAELDSKTAQGDLATDAAIEQFDAADSAAEEESVANDVAANADDADVSGGGSETFIGVDEPPPPEDGLEVLESNEDLAIFAADVSRTGAIDETVADNSPDEDGPVATESSSDDPPANSGATDVVSAANTCGLVDLVVGPATYRVGLFDEIVWVGINNAQQAVIAYDVENCREVARTALLAP